MQKKKFFLFGTILVLASTIIVARYSQPLFATTDEQTSDSTEIIQPAEQRSVFGALFEAGHLADTTAVEDVSVQTNSDEPSDILSGNTDSVLMFEPNSDGFVAITSNDAGAQWWTSDAYGLNWIQAEVNPLAEYDCIKVGRHSVEVFNEEVYFGAQCEHGATVFKLTGLNSAELVHTYGSNTTEPVAIQSKQSQNTNQNEEPVLATQYPTGAVVNEQVVMFFNGGFSKSSDGETWQDITDAKNQPSIGVPLEASTEHDNIIDVAFTSGEVATFDGDNYTIIGENYLEDLSEDANANLPAIEFFDSNLYVGNQDSKNGASIFRYDSTDSDVDGITWEEILQLSEANGIVNKMEISEPIDAKQFLVYFTSNGKEGTNIAALNESNEQIPLIMNGLGGENPEHNQEVVSLTKRIIQDGDHAKQIMLFSTKNQIDQTKIFILQLGNDLAYTPSQNEIISSPDNESTQALQTKGKYKTVTTTRGLTFTIRIPADEVQIGDVYTLFVNGKAVQRVKATGATVELNYAKASTLKKGGSFRVEVGRKVSYGEAEDSIMSRNIVKGSKLNVVIE